jgi:hypothetical protein
MYQVEDEPIETTHLYVVREAAARPSFAPIVLSLFTLSLLIVLGIVTPYKQPVTRASLRVPAVPLGIKSFTTSVAVVPTGIRTYPASTAHGVLTIKNGSVIGQSIPAGFEVGSAITDRAVYVPAGNADGYGYATVAAHALVSGVAGNLPPLAINQVIGSSVYVRNLSAFQGGKDAYSVKFVTEQDRVAAATKARASVALQVIGLHYPCQEIVNNQISIVNIIVTWRCQFITYHIPAFYYVTGVRIIGKNLIVNVWFIAPQKRIWVK